ncbi:hypothetical protein E2C01_083507 [Portunus trituberculatus]|uniref:Uncharacterized protein n=1 Tax=Portunus trituberculatus TaxID=210409 RepID=A0A5B7IXD1_PORTR|nr:hypothetical protein [Portunus trituberculatus]
MSGCRCSCVMSRRSRGDHSVISTLALTGAPTLPSNPPTDRSTWTW